MLFRKKAEKPADTGTDRIGILADELKEVKLRAERFDSEYIEKLIRRHNDLDGEVQRQRKELDLLQESFNRLLNRERSRKASDKREKEAEEEEVTIDPEEVKKAIESGLIPGYGPQQSSNNGKRHRSGRRRRRVSESV